VSRSYRKYTSSSCLLMYGSHDNLVFISVQNMALNSGFHDDRFGEVCNCLRISIFLNYIKKLIPIGQRT
jgi:hypothetical protein